MFQASPRADISAMVAWYKEFCKNEQWATALSGSFVERGGQGTHCDIPDFPTGRHVRDGGLIPGVHRELIVGGGVVHQQAITVGEKEASRGGILRQKQTLCQPSIPGTPVWRCVRLCRGARARHKIGDAQPARDANLQTARKGWALRCSQNGIVANHEYCEPAGHCKQSKLQCQEGLITGYSLTSPALRSAHLL